MRDIGRELQRRRLQRYQPAGSAWGRRGRWLVAIVGLWLVYSVFLSDHGFYRILKLQEQNRRAATELVTINRDIAELESALKSPERERQRAEEQMRGQQMARPNELIYRIKPDSAR